jgi:hypothetical protein
MTTQLTPRALDVIAASGESCEPIFRDSSAVRPMVDMVPPATARDRWMYEQGRLAERDPRTPGTHAALIEECCARIKAADDAMADRDYMLDSDDCIRVLRGTWTAPLANDCPPKASAIAAAGEAA